MELVLHPSKSDWKRLTKRATSSNKKINKLVKPILKAVKRRGDAALFEFAEKFDGVQLNKLKVEQSVIENAANFIPEDLQAAIQVAYQNIEKFHQSQQTSVEQIETTAGVTCWRKSLPIQNVGLYIPGGSAPLFSTVLMLTIPAKIAGCESIVVCSPPNKQGEIHPAILYACSLSGVNNIYKVGGAQAVAAMAYGTESILKVHKIFGPGNQFVTAAKQLVNQKGLAIDMPAGPSEVGVIADDTANPKHVAADIIAQAEHGPDSQGMLFTNSAALVEAVQEEIYTQLLDLPRAGIVMEALKKSRAIVFDSIEEAMDFSNLYAPEHLILSCENYQQLADNVVNAGSVFMGYHTPESLGDYASGTNHTLPTNGFATAYSGVSLDSFVKKVTFQEASGEGLKAIGPKVEVMAAAEALEGHKRAVTYRLETLK